MNVLASTTSDQVTLNDFGEDPLWLVILKVLVIFVAAAADALHHLVRAPRRGRRCRTARPQPRRALRSAQPIADGISWH